MASPPGTPHDASPVTSHAFLHALSRFHANLDGCLVALRHDVQLGQRDAVRSRLHGLAGAASMLGAMEVATRAADAEQRIAHDPDLPMPPWEAFGPLQASVAQLLRAAPSHLAQPDGNAPPSPDAPRPPVTLPTA